MKQERLSISMTQPQIAAMRAEAKRLGVSVGEVIRRALDAQRGALEPWRASSRRPIAPLVPATPSPSQPPPEDPHVAEQRRAAARETARHRDWTQHLTDAELDFMLAVADIDEPSEDEKAEMERLNAKIRSETSRQGV